MEICSRIPTPATCCSFPGGARGGGCAKPPPAGGEAEARLSSSAISPTGGAGTSLVSFGLDPVKGLGGAEVLERTTRESEVARVGSRTARGRTRERRRGGTECGGPWCRGGPAIPRCEGRRRMRTRPCFVLDVAVCSACLRACHVGTWNQPEKVIGPEERAGNLMSFCSLRLCTGRRTKRSTKTLLRPCSTVYPYNQLKYYSVLYIILFE
jgi:hypothetical protein